jgi:hypothetical protein
LRQRPHVTSADEGGDVPEEDEDTPTLEEEERAVLEGGIPEDGRTPEEEARAPEDEARTPEEEARTPEEDGGRLVAISEDDDDNTLADVGPGEEEDWATTPDELEGARLEGRVPELLRDRDVEGSESDVLLEAGTRDDEVSSTWRSPSTQRPDSQRSVPRQSSSRLHTRTQVKPSRTSSSAHSTHPPTATRLRKRSTAQRPRRDTPMHRFVHQRHGWVEPGVVKQARPSARRGGRRP